MLKKRKNIFSLFLHKLDSDVNLSGIVSSIFFQGLKKKLHENQIQITVNTRLLFFLLHVAHTYLTSTRSLLFLYWIKYLRLHNIFLQVCVCLQSIFSTIFPSSMQITVFCLYQKQGFYNLPDFM